MQPKTLSMIARLRCAAALLMGLPAIVAAACLAHGHGSLGSLGLLAILAGAIAAGALGAYGLLSPIRRKPVHFDTNPDFSTLSRARSFIPSKH